MTIAEPVDASSDAENPLGRPEWDDGDDTHLSTGEKVARGFRYVAYAILAAAAAWLLVTQPKARTTVLVGAASIGISASIWIGANLVFNQARDRWQTFSALAFGIVGFVLGAVISGNRAIDRGGDSFVNFIWFPLLLGVVAAVVGFVLATTNAPATRLAVGVGGMGAVGVLTGVLLDESVRPEIDAAGLIGWTALFAGIAAGVSTLRHRSPDRAVGATLVGAAFGWVVGAFGAPELGSGSAGWAIVATTVPFALLGLRLALAGNPDLVGRARVDTRSRSWIFLTPAIGFIIFALVFPGLRTAWLSFLDDDSVDFVEFGNYVDIFQDPNSWQPAEGLILSIFNQSNAISWLILAVGTLVAGAVLAVVRRGGGEGTTSRSFGLAVVGALTLLLVLGAFNWVSEDLFGDVLSFNLFRDGLGRSRLMLIGLIVLAIFVIVGTMMRRRTGRMVELGSPSMFPLLVGALLIAFAVFTSFRGTIVNNMWWVVVVTLFSTALGLAVAVLADGVGYERLGKSVIFMPMALSLVGASVIWRFMYVARDASKEQTGVLNALWVGLGRLSTGQGISSVALLGGLFVIAVAGVLSALRRRSWARALIALGVGALVVGAFPSIWTSFSGDLQRLLIGGILTLAFFALFIPVAKALTTREYGRAALPGVGIILLGWFLARYWSIWGGGIGGQRTNDNGEVIPSAINFIQESPFNNVFLMVVLIWIQTGFAMVILSAAIKAVPDEIIEAARVDGATPSQIFWRVTLPQIAPTIGVVVTTIIVLVMKVYDIVKVMTNSNFGTQVLANDMFNQAFQFGNAGRGSALAMLIFISVLPIMYTNIRRMQKES